jgi:pimeloyl-ACP methyl ester carboxylesterase
MKIKILLLLTIFLLLLFVPLLIPIPLTEGLVDHRTLADSDSKFIEIRGVDIHYKDTGERTDTEKTYILLHGFGSSTYTWQKIAQELSGNARVISYDRPAFGLTQRLSSWQDFNPYTPEAQRDIVVELMDELEIKQAILVGHSAGGLVALNTYLQYPERIEELILVTPAIYEVNMFAQYLRPLLNTPQIDSLGPLFVRRIEKQGEEILKNTWYDPSKITQESIDAYKAPLGVKGWDRALWNLTKYTYSLKPEKRLDEIEIPVLIITGDSDSIVVPENSVRLSEEISNANIEIIEECGHVPQEECPEEFLDILNSRE